LDATQDRAIDLDELFSGENGPWIEALFEDYLTGRAPVPSHWAELFGRLSGATAATIAPRALNGAATAAAPRAATSDGPPNMGVFGLVDAFRSHGHLISNLDPLGRNDETNALLDPAQFGIDESSTAPIGVGNFLGSESGTPGELLDALRRTYCGTFAVEFMEMRDKERRDWLIEQMEPIHNRPPLDTDQRKRVLEQIVEAERFEMFLHKKFLGQKRFSIEGGEALIPILETLVEDGADLGAQEMVIAMAHRGRLNVMSHVMGLPYRGTFAEFQLGLTPLNAQGSGDVKYHRGYSTDRTTDSGKQIHLSLCPNPSHLEAINPVAEGMVRAKQNLRGDRQRSQVIPIAIHGDAAFTGQGVVAETLALSELDNYWTGGTIHLIVNNQIGYTTDPRDYRFTRYPSDTAKVIQAPIFHVNADDPEACVHAARLAIQFRQRFREDVIIDLVCYRRHGHNEGDDPTYTQPLIYKQIKQHKRVGEIYTQRLLAEGGLDRDAIDGIEAAQKQRLDEALEGTQTHLRLEGGEGYHGLWEGIKLGDDTHDAGHTSVSVETLQQIAKSLVAWPEEFHPHPKIRRLMGDRVEAVTRGGPLDWGTGEALAIGSLVLEGKTVRFTGQDVERGTFGHRHSVHHDVENGARFVPLDHLSENGANFIVANSLLSEAAVLGFEYGYSTVDPNRLAIWEAQFGDFANSAQIIIDQFIASAEQKWNRSSGLVMLLPHGYEGQGPEHSSARLERFLQLCADDNMRVVNLTTPAQLFHALRRQIHHPFRKPLVVMSPKSLLRHPGAVSSVEELASGHFHHVIDDSARSAGTLDPQKVRRVVLCSGKIYYTLLAAREEHAFDDVALLRVEQLHPFPFDELTDLLAAYQTRDFAWVQEEPWNQGAWSYIRDRLKRSLPKNGRLRYIGRAEAASPATGSYRIHEEQEAEIVGEAFARRARRRRD